jgi:DNA polymerase-4
MPRTILHLDLDAFFCSVEELHDPSLQGKAFAVGGRPDERGVVASCSYPARVFGVHSAMPMSRALRLCPDLIVISHHHRDYAGMSRQVMAYLEALSPWVEQISIDEAFVDITGLGDPLPVARQLQAQVNRKLGLPCSLGVATNKLVAKIATEVGKKTGKRGQPPNALTIVPAGHEADFLAPLSVGELWGVGPKTAARLESFGIRSIGDLASHPEADLVRWLGKNGRDLHRHAQGIAEARLVTEHEAKSISQETTFPHDIQEDQILERTLSELSEQVGRRLRRAGLAGSTVRIKLRWPDFSTLTRQVTLPQPTDQDDEIRSAARQLFLAVHERGRAVRLIGVGVSGLNQPLRQLGLWDENAEKRRRLQEAVDRLQERYGQQAIQRGKR